MTAAACGVGIGCTSMKSSQGPKEVDVALAEVSAPARVTIERETAGGQVDKITREVERGKTVYDVEATVSGRHREYLVADSNGELLGTEVPIEFHQLPKPVQDAAEKYFGTSDNLIAMKGVEYGETQYEIEGVRNGKRTEVSFGPGGEPEK